MAKTNNVWGGFDKAGSSRSLRTIVLASGEVGTGKTLFGLTGPGPILVQSFDKGLEGVVEPIIEATGKDIYCREYDWNPTEEFDQDAAIAIRDQVIADFLFGLTHARTILVDKESDVRRVFEYAEFGGPKADFRDWDKVNQRYFHLLNKAKAATGVNVVFIQAMRNEWVAGATNPNTGKKGMTQTGRRIKDGFNRLDELVMTELHFTREEGQFGIVVGKCRQNANLQDQTFSGMSLPEFGTLLIEGSTVEEWS